MKIIPKSLLCFFMCCCVSLSQASTPLVYENARSLAMGGVSVSIADDEQALFCNPAGLGQQNKSKFSILNPFYAESKNFDKTLSAIDSLKDGDTAASREHNLNSLIRVMGKTGWRNRSNMSYYLGSTGFGIAAYYVDNETYFVDNPVNPRVGSKVDKDMVLSASISRPFKDSEEMFKDKSYGWWGATIKIASRKTTNTSYFIRDFSALNPSLLKNTDKSGVAMDFDLSAIWQISNPMNPTFGVFAGNIFNAKFSDDAGNLERQFGAGVSIRPLTGDLERKNRILLALEYWDIGDEGNAFKKLRLGSQIQLSKTLHAHLGIRSGYPSYGFSFAWHDLELQAAMYSEELGKRPGDFEDKRCAFGATLEF